MVQSFCILLISLLVIQNSNAQRPGGGQYNPEEMLKRQLETLTEKLSLTDEQVPKVEEILAKYGKQMMEVRQSAGGDRDKMMEAMQKMSREQSIEMKEVLDDEQYMAYLKYQEERRSQRGQRPQRQPQREAEPEDDEDE